MVPGKILFGGSRAGREDHLKKNLKTAGLRYWMERVLEECDKAGADFQPDPVHDLRVALRRCRSLADGLIAMDPDRNWKAMKKAGKKLFQSLGALRDVQIMMEWIDTLEFAERRGTPTSAVPKAQPEPGPEFSAESEVEALLQILRSRESEHKHEARAALEEFDRKQWRQWSETLPARAGRIRPGSAVFKHLALERWSAARQLHTRAMRARSGSALHSLRIGIKRFRYIVENFLPQEHQVWGKDLKHVQDLLGEVHDLDVLWATAVEAGIFSNEAARQVWHERILAERNKRVEEYGSLTNGAESLWNVWRAGLPHGGEIQKIATQRMKLWAKALDPDFAHSERVAKLALQLHDGLEACGIGRHSSNGESARADERAGLYLGALLHDVGKAKGNRGHQKRAMELIKAHGTPLGWKAENIRQAALLARFHDGALPARNHKALRDLPSDEQKMVIRLAAILRLANALDVTHDGHVRSVKVENVQSPKQRRNGFRHKPAGLGKNEALVIAAAGYRDGTATAQAVAAERYLLETVLKRPILVKTAAAAQGRAVRLGRGVSPVQR
jgi:CHAD domain-containing protein/HD superfamily phosphodiesterase